MNKNKIGILTLKINNNDTIYINDAKAVFSITPTDMNVVYMGRAHDFLPNQYVELGDNFKILSQRLSAATCSIKFFADKNVLILKEHLYLRGKPNKVILYA